MSKAILLLLVVVSFSCSIKESSHSESSHFGTWMLVSNTLTTGDSVNHVDIDNQKSIKILNDTHFAFFTHQRDSTKTPKIDFVSGGGTYTLKGKVYTEFLEYCNMPAWENNQFTFNLEIKGDSLIQSGEEEVKELGIKRIIVEKYIRIR